MYSTGVLLLDLDKPGENAPADAASIFEPTADFERQGFVPDVVFPTGIVETAEFVSRLLRGRRLLHGGG